ncbi:MAG: hypothetical protein HY925_02210 [Elusimicrobia bacterium]|nr:hypothetical protein [Elusimicrobiota bacterium]
MTRKSLFVLGAALGLTAGSIAYVRAGSSLTGETDATVKNTCKIQDVFLNPIASQVYIGSNITLTWSSTDATTLESNFGETALNGSKSQYLGSLGAHTFTVTAKSDCGDASTMSRTVTVVNPPPPPPPPPPYHRCFVAGTQISMADGTYKNVEDVKPGDKVFSSDENGKKIISTVTDRYKSEWDSFYQINGSNGVTGPHLFMANGKWTRVDELKVGDKLVDEKGNPVEITKIVKRPGPVDIFPLFVENPPSNYFAEGVLVHNKDNQLDEGEGLLAGTKVLMADGTRKAIELVREGEGLMAFWPKSKGMGTAKVKKVWPNVTVNEYVVINDKLAMGPKHRVISMKKGAGEEKKK